VGRGSESGLTSEKFGNYPRARSLECLKDMKEIARCLLSTVAKVLRGGGGGRVGGVGGGAKAGSPSKHIGKMGVCQKSKENELLPGTSDRKASAKDHAPPA